jgi:hypothetical protein
VTSDENRPPRVPTALQVRDAVTDAFRATGESTLLEWRGEDGQRVTAVRAMGVLEPRIVGYSTLDLHVVPNHVADGDRRIELLMLGPADEPRLDQVLAEAALQTAAGRAPAHAGSTYTGLVGEVIPEATVPHAWLTAPYGFHTLSSVEVTRDLTVGWLLLMPITDRELLWMEDHGGDALAERLALEQVEFWDLGRPSIV